MTVLINYKPVLNRPTGIGVYANAVFPALQALPHVFLPGGEAGSAAERLKRLAWSQLELPRLARQHRAALVFTPAPEGYLGSQNIPQVVMVHDLRPITHPERSFQSLYFRCWVPQLLRSCRHVVTNSRFTLSEIQRCTGLAEDKITVTPLGYDNQVFHPALAPTASREYSYLLHVGQAYPHKNVFGLIQSFASLVERYPYLNLVLAGKPHATETPKHRALVRELGLESKVEFRDYVPYEELPNLYRGALALVYPSFWEGFGLPILEAMACGVPVVTSYGSGMEEVAGDAALYVDPQSTASIINAVSLLIDSPYVVSSLVAKGLERSSRFSWSTCALSLKSTIVDLMG